MVFLLKLASKETITDNAKDIVSVDIKNVSFRYLNKSPFGQGFQEIFKGYLDDSKKSPRGIQENVSFRYLNKSTIGQGFQEVVMGHSRRLTEVFKWYSRKRFF